MPRLTWLLALVVLAATLVVVGGDRPSPPKGSIRAVQDLGPVAWDHRILGRDGGLSARWGDDTIWVFGDTVMSVPGADGDQWADNSSAITSDLDAVDGISLAQPQGVEHLDAARLPTEYLPFSPWEAEFNHRNDPARCGAPGVGDCGTQYFLWPGPVVADPSRDRILFFLTSGRRHGAISGYQMWGSGLAVWDARTGRTTRPRQGPGAGSLASDHWTMFARHEIRYPTMAVTVGEMLYAYGCEDVGQFEFRCTLARVPLAQVLTRPAWRFYTGRGRWSPDSHGAVTVFNGSHSGSVFYNRHLGRYMVVYGFTAAYYRTAPHPWGPWSRPARMFDTVPPARDFTYFVLAHPEYGDGRVLYLTYTRPTEFGWEVRLARVTLT
ncbi:MAG TPA: DUF4185 domain-containing protein [Micromonosporaceae bacterium]